MAFTVRDYQDMVRLLDQHPEWQAELRRLLLADDFLALPAIVRDLAASQERTEERLEQLAVAQQRTEERLGQLAVAQQHTEERLGQLAADVRALTVGVQNLTAEVRQLADWQRGEAGRREGERYELRIPSAGSGQASSAPRPCSTAERAAPLTSPPSSGVLRKSSSRYWPHRRSPTMKIPSWPTSSGGVLSLSKGGRENNWS